MPSPFPGMDPYIESTGIWSSFHHAFINACHDQLNQRLPADYIAAIEERVLMVSESEAATRSRAAEPDVAVLHAGSGGSFRRAVTPGQVTATLDPVTLPQPIELLDVPTQLYIRVVHLPEQRLVTDFELLSPANKKRGGDDRAAYLSRRQDLLRHEVNLVEVDLLLAGDRLPMRAPLPTGDYYMFLTRWQTNGHCDVYAWSLHQALPTIPIPLRTEDGDIGLDLAATFAQTYERGRYDRLLSYGPPPPILSDQDRAWVTERLTARPR
jgi:hypothetical protein